MNTFKNYAISFLAVIFSLKSQNTMPHRQFLTFVEVSTIRYHYFQKEMTYALFNYEMTNSSCECLAVTSVMQQRPCSKSPSGASAQKLATASTTSRFHLRHD